MALMTVLQFPDERLRTKAEPVTEFNKELRALADDMYETMYANNGIGLAATQVNVHKHMAVIDVSEDKKGAFCLINIEILEKSGKETMGEGCLSVSTSSVYENVTRSEHVKIRYQDLDGKTVELETGGLLAVCIQHEADHLDGKLFVDHLSRLKFSRIKKKIEKLRKQNM